MDRPRGTVHVAARNRPADVIVEWRASIINGLEIGSRPADTLAGTQPSAHAERLATQTGLEMALLANRFTSHALMAAALGVVALAGGLTNAWAAYDPAKEYVERREVAGRYPDPAVEIATPAFRAGRADFTSQAELESFVLDLGARSPDLRVRVAGRSQEDRAIPLLVFARPSAAGGPDVLKNGKPTVLIIGQQHGNEPAGGEAALALALELATTGRAGVLDKVNVLIVPRANPDGAFHFVRGLHDGGDVNRDHLLQVTPEGRALGRVFSEFQPDVVLDCHEFGVRTRWFEKFGTLQGYDALIQYATVSNLPVALTTLAEQTFRQPLLRALDAEHLSHSWYYASTYDMKDPVVSMGGVAPDTGRNVAGLRNSVSFLIETRGVGIGKAHFKRRVHTHLVAMNAFLDSAAQNGPALLTTLRDIRGQVASQAGSGNLIVSGAATPTRHTLAMIDPDTGADKEVEVAWRDALQLQIRLERSRPSAYVLPASETEAVRHLRLLGVTVLRIAAPASVSVEQYRVTASAQAKKEDVRRNDDDAAPSVIRVTTALEPAAIGLRDGDFYVPLDQPLANVIGAALEPETQSSFLSNRLLTFPKDTREPILPLYRLSRRVGVPVVVRDRE